MNLDTEELQNAGAKTTDELIDELKSRIDAQARELARLHEQIVRAVFTLAPYDDWEWMLRDVLEGPLEDDDLPMYGATLDDLKDDGAPSDKVKYRNPENPTETWGGRGKRPAWLRERLEQGATLDQFKVEGLPG